MSIFVPGDLANEKTVFLAMGRSERSELLEHQNILLDWVLKLTTN
jgi:hypothetical protein